MVVREIFLSKRGSYTDLDLCRPCGVDFLDWVRDGVPQPVGGDGASLAPVGSAAPAEAVAVAVAIAEAVAELAEPLPWDRFPSEDPKSCDFFTIYLIEAGYRSFAGAFRKLMLCPPTGGELRALEGEAILNDWEGRALCFDIRSGLVEPAPDFPAWIAQEPHLGSPRSPVAASRGVADPGPSTRLGSSREAPGSCKERYSEAGPEGRERSLP